MIRNFIKLICSLRTETINNYHLFVQEFCEIVQSTLLGTNKIYNTSVFNDGTVKMNDEFTYNKLYYELRLAIRITKYKSYNDLKKQKKIFLKKKKMLQM